MKNKEIEKQLFTENHYGIIEFHDDLWKNCLQLIKEKVSDTTFRTWFEPIISLKYEDNTLTIGVPSISFYHYLEENYTNLLREILDKSFNKRTKLKYHVLVTDCKMSIPLLGPVSIQKIEPPTGVLETTRTLTNETLVKEKPKNEYTCNDKQKGFAPIYAMERHRLATDGNGVTTLVAFHKCLLKCKYCINPQTWQADEVLQKLSAKELYEEVKKDNLYFLATGGGITFGGGEPCLYSDYIVEFREICNPKWNLTIETSLCVGESHIKNLLSVIDYWIIDIKDMDNKRYKKYTGSSNSLMIKNLKYLIKHGKTKHMLVRVPYIEGYNTRDDVYNNVVILRELGVVNIDTFDYKTSNDTKNNDYHLTGSPQRVGAYVIDDSLPF